MSETPDPGAEYAGPSRVDGFDVPVTPAPYVGPSRVSRPSVSPKLHGTLLVQNQSSETGESLGVSERIADIHGMQAQDPDSNLQTILGGNSVVLSQKRGLQALPLAEICGDLGMASFKNSKLNPGGYQTEARMYLTGGNYYQFYAVMPAQQRFKFYFSLDTTTPEGMQRATEFTRELLEYASLSSLPLEAKTSDFHAYDVLDAYTWDPEAMIKAIKWLYPRHKDAFLDTTHPLQGAIDGVSQEHVGWVQEPVGGDSQGNSHSSRMAELGKILDDKGLTPATYRIACEKVGVQPEKPWLLNEDEVSRYVKKRQKRLYEIRTGKRRVPV